jgi:hypothetical protein
MRNLQGRIFCLFRQRLPDIASGSNDLRQQGSVAVGYRGHRDNQRSFNKRPAQDASSSLFRKNIMQLNSLFRSLLAAYACGASGSGAEESNQV